MSDVNCSIEAGRVVNRLSPIRRFFNDVSCPKKPGEPWLMLEIQVVSDVVVQ